MDKHCSYQSTSSGVVMDRLRSHSGEEVSRQEDHDSGAALREPPGLRAGDKEGDRGQESSNIKRGQRDIRSRNSGNRVNIIWIIVHALSVLDSSLPVSGALTQPFLLALTLLSFVITYYYYLVWLLQFVAKSWFGCLFFLEMFGGPDPLLFHGFPGGEESRLERINHHSVSLG